MLGYLAYGDGADAINGNFGFKVRQYMFNSVYSVADPGFSKVGSILSLLKTYDGGTKGGGGGASKDKHAWHNHRASMLGMNGRQQAHHCEKCVGSM